ncbi:MAG: hypothetical protein NTY12_03225 [Candidatus Falkowbacteria bacterium]|nr:hypothetical protein [Candidatus Falkowbacteria bacterium]
MKRFRNLSIMVFLLAIITVSLVNIYGCGDNAPLSPTSIENQGSSYLSLSLKDSLTNTQLIGDSGYVGQVLIVVGTINIPNATSVTWRISFGNGTIFNGTGFTAVGGNKYLSAGIYNILLEAWDQNNVYYHTNPKPFYVLAYQGNLLPVFKVISSVPVPNTNLRDYTLGFLRRAIVACTPTIPFFADTLNNSWNITPFPNPADTSDGYLKIVKRFADNEIDAFTFGGSYSNGCYAWIAPNLPFWTSAYFRMYGNSQKLYARFNGGVAYTLDNPAPSSLPGIFGDSGSVATTRVGVNSTRDTIYVYLCKLRASGVNNAYCTENIHGMGTNQVVYDTPGYPDWWYIKFSINALPSNTPFTYRYGTSNGLANMSMSYMWNPINSWLEFLPTTIGDNLNIYIPGQKKTISIKLPK